MSDAPERIYLNVHPDDAEGADFDDEGVTWSQDPINQNDIEYIHADKAICYVSHNIKWLGEKGAPGWCLGCGKHRALIRESGDA